MKNIFVPFHQFEIRFTEILDFNQIKLLINPFTKIANKVQIQDENIHVGRIIFSFEDIGAYIHVFWDRIMFIIEGTVNEKPDKNTFILKNYFKIFETLQNSDSFGNVRNILYYKILINNCSDEDNICRKISNETLSNSFLNNFPEFYEIGIFTEYNYNNAQVYFNYGNYSGLKDLKRRNITLANINSIKKATELGEMIEFKYHEITSEVSLKIYLDIFDYESAQIGKIWKS